MSAAVDAGRRLGVPILLDVPSGHVSAHWIADMEQAGVDGFAITTDIGIGVGATIPWTAPSPSTAGRGCRSPCPAVSARPTERCCAAPSGTCSSSAAASRRPPTPPPPPPAC
ncbi:hypothetical protein ACR6C2_06615 [Streptomyces sp. INA 01156]